MKRESVKVEKRTVLGKKVKKLRRDQGLLPANVYGKDMKSQAVQLPIKNFQELYKKVHETGLVDLELDGQTLPVLIYNVQINPKTHEALHADFFKVNLKEKITANIPVVAVGEAKAVADNAGVLLTLLSELEVEALPTELPEKFEVHVENLAAVGDQITVSQVQVPEGVTLLTDAEQAIFKIDELVSREAEEQAAAEEAAAAEASAETAPEEGKEEKAPEEQKEASAPENKEEKTE